ncbi:MAG: 30S ribosomal protein S12 methylthiotransferase RimO [Chloroflexi bacterium HGW-Chloroflexi-2]|jgi:ribosomal protein S12 methylthiotransferase|nr:MAG: 30S ribosomal protein S12 methylthiotransferase RimO [Chloroflexi bacterium HGW-Chloroflexi-2]
MKPLKKETFYLLSLGCAKNLVDSDSISHLLTQGGLRGVEKPEQAEVLIVNTCGFIKPASDESITELRNLAKRKKKGQILIAAGCLTQRYREMVAEQVPGLDGIIGTRRWMDILDLIQELRTNPNTAHYHIPDAPTMGTDERGILRAAIQGSNAYLKIADGCRRACAYCAIPLIKGTQVSRPMETIVLEAQQLASLGIKELILIAQDTTDYGSDLGFKDGLAKLLEEITDQVPQIQWIRMLYAFPGVVTDNLIEVMKSRKQILPYIDIPLQHADTRILKSMRRPSNMQSVKETIAKLRSALPDIAIRTTFIVGYPGESEEEFQTLLDFMQEIQFDHVGAFTYFQEKGTFAEKLGDPVPENVKQKRLERLMSLQQDISLQKNQTWVGKSISMLVEGYNDGISIGRSFRDAPEIDGMVFVEGNLPIGEIVEVKVTDALVHDLIAKPI